MNREDIQYVQSLIAERIIEKEKLRQRIEMIEGHDDKKHVALKVLAGF